LLIHSSYVEMKIRMGGRVDDTFLPQWVYKKFTISIKIRKACLDICPTATFEARYGMKPLDHGIPLMSIGGGSDLEGVCVHATGYISPPGWIRVKLTETHSVERVQQMASSETVSSTIFAPWALDACISHGCEI
jgi:hypothetical protein